MVSSPAYSLGALRRRPPLDDEERFCNRLAESLLMPAGWIAAEASRGPTLENLQRTARRAGVSLSAALVSLNRVADWRRGLLRWRREPAGWRLMSCTGQVPARVDALLTLETTSRALNAIEAGDGVFRGALPLGVDGRRLDVDADVSIDHATAVALIAPIGARRRATGRFAPRPERTSSPVEHEPVPAP